MKHVKPIVITDERTGGKYTLEYNAKAIIHAEEEGFIVTEDDLKTRPLSMFAKLFAYAFYMHHPDITMDAALEMFEEIELTEEVANRLVELYSAVYELLAAANGAEDKDGKKETRPTKVKISL